ASVVTCQLAAIDDVGIQGVGRNVAVFFRCHRMPVSERNLSVVAARENAGRTALLLSTADAIGKRVVGAHVIHLRRALVVPATPGAPTVHGDDRTLVTHQDDRVWITWVDPDVLVVVSARRAAEASPGFSAVNRLPSDCARYVHDVGI